MKMSLLQSCSGINGFLDFTCINRQSRIQVDGDDNYFIGGYKGGDDRGADVTFRRVLRTYHTEDMEQGLPAGWSQINHPHIGSRAILFNMPVEGGVDRVGAYYCQATKGDETERITTTVMSRNSKILRLRIEI